MTRKVFWEDPYQTTLETRVATVCGDQVTLESTIFYAFSGGQESDGGSIGGQAVLAARKDGTEIFYTLASQHGLQPAQPVRVEIDWPRRYRLMRLHFAAEVVLELAERALHQTEKIGAHIAADKARIDFAWPQNIAPLLPALAQQAQAIIAADSAIVSAFSDQEKQRRYWELAGFARVPCGGTHPKRTGEVGTLRLKRNNIGRGKERIEIFVD